MNSKTKQEPSALKPLHIVWILANNSEAPYFTWFAARAQEEKNVQFSFVSLFPERSKLIDELEALGCKAYWIPFDQQKRGRSMLAALWKLARLFRRIKADAVHAHLFDDAVPSLAAARMAGIKARIITKGDTGFHWYFAPKGVKYDRLNNRNASHILALSEESKKFILEKEEADPKKLVLIHHGVPENIRQQTEEAKKRLRERFRIGENDIVIGTVSRLIEWKGYRHIIGAAAKLSGKYPNLRFLFTGSGAMKSELETLVRENRLEKQVQFTGWIERNDIPSLYGIMDIYLHAAAHEPFGFVIAEAMLNGVPVVSTCTGAAGDAIEDGRSGIFAAEQSAEAIAAALERMLNTDRKKIGREGQIRAEMLFTFELMWQKHLELYRNACR